ncbi:MAG: glycosyltransferase family 4 protein [Solirubrobacteraceae bacterium]
MLEVCDYHGPYAGNFIPSLVAVGEAVRSRLGLEYRCAFPREMADRPWVATVEAAGIPVSFLDGDGTRRERLGGLTATARAADSVLMRSHFTGWDIETAVSGRRLGAAVVWNIHTGNLHYGLKRRLSDLIKVRLLGRLCDRVIGVSDEIGREARMRGFAAERVRPVLNGIDMSRFAVPDLPSRETARADLALTTDERVVLVLGWTPYRKGVDVVVRAVGRPHPLDRVTVLAVGAEALRQSLPAPLPAWLRIVEPVPDARVLYAAADVFVSASREEAFSYAIGEAMAMRLPIISSDIPGPSAYFDAPGLVRYPAEDALALRAALTETLARPSRIDGNRDFVIERLGLERHVDGVLSVFEEALQAR